MPQPNPSVQLEDPPKIVFVRQQFSPFGGAELILDRILAALRSHPYKVTLLARSWQDDRKGVEFILCNPPKLLRSLREVMFARAACRMIGKMPGALVQAHERISCCDIFRAGDGVHAAYLEQKLRTETALGKTAIRLSLFHRNTLKLEREMFASPRLKAVIVNSEMVAGDLVHHYGYPRERIHFVPNGIDLQRFSLAARERLRVETRRTLGIAENKSVILFVGSGFERKGLGFAIETVAQSGIDAELVVIGRDRRPGKFVAQAKRAGLGGRFHLIGAVTDSLPYYAAADALMLPSIYDPFPSTVIEALACGLPVITTTGCGARDVVRRLESALVCDALDRRGLAEALACALDLAAIPQTRNTARNIAEAFGIDPMVDRMLALYDNMITDRARTFQ
jgi:UDP-glucose:(heptosyl)LPS alpha-1,3-glucosyltransferase